ncbi:MAG: hypothetical protein CV088_04370 [Nitrospira sp. LK70]|nr:hypothetical protein [Nitrospira sp. LK70]
MRRDVIMNPPPTDLLHEGSTPLALAILNEEDRFSLGIGVIDRVPGLQESGAHVKNWLQDQILEHLAYAHEHGIDPPEVRNWKWP